MSNIVQGVGKVFFIMFFWAFLLYVALPKANFKIVSVLVSNIGVSYYEAVTPLYILLLLWASYTWIVKAKT